MQPLRTGVLRSLRHALALLLLSAPALAEEAGHTEPKREEIEAWLDSHSVEADVAEVSGPEEGLPAAPKHHGWLIESGVGALGHLGELKHVSPVAPRFWLRAGYEFAAWFLAFAEADLTLGNTSYARQPPDPRGYALYGFGAGLRGTFEFVDGLGVFLQGSLGVARVDEDVLATYGYQDTTSLNPYFGGMLGVVFYMPNPHLRLLLEGGVRNYAQGLDRTLSNQTPLAWLAGPAIGYAF